MSDDCLKHKPARVRSTFCFGSIRRSSRPSPLRGYLFLVALALPLFAGCSKLIEGHWNMVEAVPNKETISIDNVWFKEGNNYSAVTTRDGVTASEAGKYEYDGFKVNFRPS